MKEKRIFFSEIAYVLGILTLALGAALMERASFGMSMIVAPAYLIHLKASQFLEFYTFGISEYIFQAFLLITLSLILRKFKKSYLLSLVTAFIYGSILDVTMLLVAHLPCYGIIWQIFFYVVGVFTCTVAVALLFHTYLPPEAYELFVKELSQEFNITITKAKTIYDCCSCIISIIFSFCFFGFGVFIGIGWGTILCALVNGWLIGQISSWLEKRFIFKDALPLRNKLKT